MLLLEVLKQGAFIVEEGVAEFTTCMLLRIVLSQSTLAVELVLDRKTDLWMREGFERGGKGRDVGGRRG